MKKNEIIIFDKYINEPINLIVGNTKIGKGEIIVNENNQFGIIITEIEKKIK